MALHDMQTTLPNPTGPCAKRRRGGDEKGNLPSVKTYTARDTQQGNPLVPPLRPRRRLNRRHRPPPRQYGRPGREPQRREAWPAGLRRPDGHRHRVVASVVEHALGHGERRLRPDVADVAHEFCSLWSALHSCLQMSCLSVCLNGYLGRVVRRGNNIEKARSGGKLDAGARRGRCPGQDRAGQM